jgi:antitoxin FitA
LIFRPVKDIMISGGGRSVAQFVVRNIEAEVKLRLQRRAKRHGRSMEEEVRDILRNAAREEDAPAGGLGTQIASLFKKIGLNTEIPELRGEEVKPPSFD